jgi:hypothetical protein
MSGEHDGRHFLEHSFLLFGSLSIWITDYSLKATYLLIS